MTLARFALGLDQVYSCNYANRIEDHVEARSMRFVFILAACWLALAASVKAQDFYKGFVAYQAGDYATALAEWRPLAEQGNADAQTWLGLMYLDGKGVPQDYAEAVRLYRLAAGQGNAFAQTYLGLMYDNGTGVPKDDAEAVRWYRLAAEQGDAYAQTNLGVMYVNGRGVRRDYAEAARWFRAAAEQGIADAQAKLGASYAAGMGVPEDYVTAHMWLNLAAASGVSSAADLRNDISGLMSPADISEAQRRARICLASNYTDCD